MDIGKQPGVLPQFFHQPLRQSSLEKEPGMRAVGDTGFGNGEREVGIWGYLGMLGTLEDTLSLLDWLGKRH